VKRQTCVGPRGFAVLTGEEDIFGTLYWPGPYGLRGNNYSAAKKVGHDGYIILRSERVKVL